MKFVDVADSFNKIEQESSRLKITYLLADLLKKATPGEAAIISYFSLGNLNPTYIGSQFNFASKGMIKVIAKLLDSSESAITAKTKKIGDQGLILEESEWELSNKEHLTVSQINKKLHEFLELSGTGSQEKKEKYLLDLLKELEPVSAKYIVRIILGKLRLGFSDMTLLDAFSWMYAGDKSIRKDLEAAYNVCVDIGLIIKTLKKDGLEGIKEMSITPGVPIRLAAAERLPDAKAIVEKLGECIAQPKLDGFRLQVHIDKTKSPAIVRFFSRNLKDMSDMFPDLKEAVLKLNVETFVAEGEAIAYDTHSGVFLPFQETVKRKRKHDIAVTAQEFPLKLYFFDILYFNDKSLLGATHEHRRNILLKIVDNKEVKKEDTVFAIDEKKIQTYKDLENYFVQNISAGLEGLVVKKPDAIYQAGKRNFNWVKLKRQETGKLDDTIDCVILGYYAGRGKRASFGIGALLVGVYDKQKDRFETVAKIGTGLKDDEWKEVKEKCDKIKVSDKPKNVECAKELYPDVWVNPDIVCMIRADEITLSPLHAAGGSSEKLGMALRFPRFMGYRPDKSALQATTVKELKHLYSIQFSSKTRKSSDAKKKKRVIKVMSIF